MKKLELNQMEQIHGEGWRYWAEFSVVAVVGVSVVGAGAAVTCGIAQLQSS